MKRNKSTKGFHEFLLFYAYSLISFLLVHPSRPTFLTEIKKNEANEMREKLKMIGIPTPELLGFNGAELVEEYIDGGDLYRVLASGKTAKLAQQAGSLTAILHNAGFAFIDNKAQNYLVRSDSKILRTDLAFMQKTFVLYARSMDIGSFLASTMDLERYPEIEQAFYAGYVSESNRRFPYLSIIIRNLLSLGFSSHAKTTFENMMLDCRELMEF